MFSYQFLFASSRFATADIKMIAEQIIAVGRKAARQVISGIMHREMMIPGTMAEMTEAIAAAADRTYPKALRFDRNRRMPKIIITQEMMAIAIFALWQCI
jgi:hypothetical protein